MDTSLIGIYEGIQIISSPYMVKTVITQWFIPKSKKKRIIKKCKKLYTKSEAVPMDKVYFFGKNKLICHPSIAVRLEWEIKTYGEIRNITR